MEEVKTNNNTDAKVVASLLGDSNNKVARYIFENRREKNFVVQHSIFAYGCIAKRVLLIYKIQSLFYTEITKIDPNF